ncbi:hypothetical protein ACFLX7_01815 [Chloroflexota bacterium]
MTPKMIAAIHGPISQRYFLILHLLLEMDTVIYPNYYTTFLVSLTALLAVISLSPLSATPASFAIPVQPLL